MASVGDNRTNVWQAEFTASYDNTFKRLHHVNLLGGYTTQRTDHSGFATTISPTETPFIYNGQETVAYYIVNKANPDLKWEKTASYNVGISSGFFQNRLNVTLDAYYKKTSDLLLQVPVEGVTGYATSLRNVGSVTNKGVELEVGAVLIDRKDWKWNVNANIAHNKNDLTVVSDSRYVEDASYLRVKNIQLGYTLPVPQITKDARLRLYLSLQNFFTITNYSGYDPEGGRNGASEQSGIYQSESDIKVALNGVYQVLTDGSMNGPWNDELIFLNDLQSEYARRGTAKFLRALYYFDLVRLFGDVPLVLHDGEGEGEPRTSKDEVYQQIVEDLTEAEGITADFPKLSSEASSLAASGLLSKVYITWAQSDSEFSKAHQSELYQKAIDAANKVVLSGKYQLVNKFIDNWSLDKKEGPELI